jgi:hypothetical protein
MMLMADPVDNRAMDFHITTECHTTYLEHSIPNVRPTIRIQLSRMQNAQRAPIIGVQLFTAKVLPAPDVSEKALVDIERARAHGEWSWRRRVRQNMKNVLRNYEKNLSRYF